MLRKNTDADFIVVLRTDCAGRDLAHEMQVSILDLMCFPRKISASGGEVYLTTPPSRQCLVLPRFGWFAVPLLLSGKSAGGVCSITFRGSFAAITMAQRFLSSKRAPRLMLGRVSVDVHTLAFHRVLLKRNSQQTAD
ncbi:hypothetical protein [Rhizobium sp. YTU87027]|uniref:hypothetical protein n=1 Tax=Rhizobium sp. YTU87027 TaxID=3417741 RepID=UPI003D692D19